MLRETQDVGLAKETVSLEEQAKSDLDALEARTDPMTEPLEAMVLKPTRQNISVRLAALAWAPYWRDPAGAVTEAWN